MSGIVAVTDEMKDAAGILVFWELSGLVAMEDFVEAIAADGWEPELAPVAPSMEVALGRAATSVLADKRMLLRPLSRRGSWEILREQVSLDVDDGEERVKHESLLRGSVQRSGSEVQIQITGDPDLKQAVLAKVGFYSSTLTASDVSNWMLAQANRLHAVGLRSRGGFYFIPRDRIEDWHRVVRVIRACSSHQVYEIPAMRTDEAVEAILASVRAEAASKMAELEAWLAGDVHSTRGYNASERAVVAVQAKLRHYAELLGREMPDLDGRLVQLTGALTAARLAEQAAEDAAQP